MKLTTLPLLTGFALLAVSCNKKPSTEVAKETKNEAVVLARKDFMPPAGTIATKENTMVMTDAVLKVKAGPQEMEGIMTQTEVDKETHEILSQDKYRRILASKSTSGKMKLNGQDQPVPEKADPLLGVPVIVERKAGKWTASLESGGAPSLEQKGRLEKLVKSAEADSDFAMYGDTPRKPGDKWDVDPAKLMSFGDAEKLTGTYAVEFVEIKEVQGVSCAVLKGTFDIKGKTESDPGSPQLDIRLKGEAVSQRSIKDMIDLDVEVNATATLSGSPAAQVTMQVEGPMRFTQKISLKRP